MNVIETVDLTKKYGQFVANDRINVAIPQGQITAIVGENGAGKTTLMNMFYGLLRPTDGKLMVKGREVQFSSPLEAIDLGLGMVHQHFKLVPSLTVFENIVLGVEMNRAVNLFNKLKVKSPLIDKRGERQAVQELIDSHKLELNADDLVKDLSVGEQQRVEILKMLYRNVDILIFDEPTSALTPQEVDELLHNFKELKKQGKTVIFITHKLREVMEASDQVIVLKRGRVVGSMPTRETSPEVIARLMVGRDVLLTVEKDEMEEDWESRPVVYEVKNLATEVAPGVKCPRNISFSIRSGEILGIAGVEGNGQSELVKVLSGLMEAVEGTVHLDGQDVTNKWPDELRRAGLGIIPEDRYAQGLCREMRVAENLVSGRLADTDFCRRGLLRKQSINRYRDELVQKYDIRLSDRDCTVSALSGGNAQKVIIAREFDAEPKVLIACQPTRGVDIGSIEFIHNKILALKRKDRAVLLVSSELSEVMSLSDRILVMYKGEIVGEVDGRDADTEQIGLLMAGITPHQPAAAGGEQG